jgi:tryptophan-rich sensory protein
MINIIKLIVAILICEGAGVIGSIFTMSQIQTWYAGINKPSFNPPGWIFGPVWTILFLMMGIALYLVYQKGWMNQNVKIAIAVFALQLLLNIVWSLLFFGAHSPLLALIDIIFLLVAIVFTIFQFYPISQLAGLLLIPYVLWVSFASVLNYFIVKLN